RCCRFMCRNMYEKRLNKFWSDMNVAGCNEYSDKSTWKNDMGIMKPPKNTRTQTVTKRYVKTGSCLLDISSINRP
ncbi:MAG: hypothetical protein ACERKS_12560, partial [Candidatus Bathyarchaeota archaeon]